ncbi:hypothetical protein IKX12_02145 [Candidatus Saccharibacteria bacterium]|nr:hypothetical protein [Candidatus Saccharibacteria bacterium]
MDLAAARKLEADYNSAQKQVSSTAKKLSEKKGLFDELSGERSRMIEEYWEDINDYFDNVFKGKLYSDPAVTNVLSSVIIKWADADTFMPQAWYYRYLEYSVSAETILKDANWKHDGSNFVVISRDHPDLEKYETALFSYQTLIFFPYLRSHSWDSFIGDKDIIMAFFYRQSGEDIRLAVEKFKDFVENSAKNPDYSIEKCSHEGSLAYKGDLYAIALADNSLEEKRGDLFVGQ